MDEKRRGWWGDPPNHTAGFSTPEAVKNTTIEQADHDRPISAMM
jgi:hypothetical protein